MAQYRLHCVGGSGNAYKVAFYLNCAGLDWEPVGVDFAGGETRDATWRADINQMGEVPVLEVAGTRMSQSGAILLWLAETTGKFAPAATQRFETMRWLFFDNHKFTANYAMHRFQNSLTPEPETLFRSEGTRRRHVLDRREAPCGSPLRARRGSDHRGLLHGGVHLLSTRGDRLRHRGRLSGDRCLAPAPCGLARLEAAVRADAGRTFSAGAHGVVGAAETLRRHTPKSLV
jgi:hypothetical protein